MLEQQLKCRCFGRGLSRLSQFYIPEAKPHHPPDRLVDVEHIRLEIAVNLQEKSLKGTCTTRFRAVAPSVARMIFDAVDLVVEKVMDPDGKDLHFDRQPDRLIVFLGKAFQPGEESQVVIHYHVIEPRAGLYFIAPDHDYPNRPWQLWTQGQDQDNRYWFPCHDHPNEKATTEMVVTVDERYGAVSNGRLVSVQSDPQKKTKTFHYEQAVPHATYLVTLCVGEFVEVEDIYKNMKGDVIPILYYTRAGREAETQFAFGKTPKMIEYFSKSIGVDYPYAKYAQIVAYDFIYGGMENTSATTQTEHTLHPETVDLDYSSEPLVSHELAHQWFGDLLTCKDWSHAWLNEGFATYFESLWTEHEHGKDEFLYELFGNEKLYKGEDGESYRRPIVTNVYVSPSDLFDRHLYEKGGRVLHMLRKLVGDEIWWKAINRYVTAYFGKTVETVDLQRVFEELSGRSLSWFFEQWVFKAGHPEIKGSVDWLDDRKVLKVTLVQKQKQNDLTAKFRLPLRMKIATSVGEMTHGLELTENEQVFWLNCSEKPKFVSLNPENEILANWDFDPGRSFLVEQLLNDKDVMGRIFAARALSKDHSRESIDALSQALKNEKFWGVQVEICESLEKIGSTKCFDALVARWSEMRHPKARKSAIRAIAGFRNDRAVEILEKALKGDPSPLVQYEAGQGLGRTRAAGVFEKLSTALGKRDSWHDYYDRGILLGLANLKHDERVFSVLAKNVRPGVPIFVRRDALEGLVRYGTVRASLVLETLMELTKDPNFFIRLGAVDGLHRLGDDRAAAALKRVVDSAVEPRTRRAAIVALKAVREGKGPSEDVEKLRGDFDRLREEYRGLLNRLEKLEAQK